MRREPDRLYSGDGLRGYRRALGVRQVDVARHLGWPQSRIHVVEGSLRLDETVIATYLAAVDVLGRTVPAGAVA